MADDDFEIDLYGDAGMEGNEEAFQANGAIDGDKKEGDVKQNEDTAESSTQSATNENQSTASSTTLDAQSSGQNGTSIDQMDYANGDADATHEEQTQSDVAPSKSAGPSVESTSVQQGVKRKESHDDRPIDPGASSAITVSELHWWVTDDEIRGWANQRDCEAELKDITFSEHKVNGKSKGQAYMEFESPQAATSVKHHIEGLAASQPSSNKYTVVFSSPATNPFRTLPRNDAQRNTPNNTGARGNFNNQGSFRGNRGGRGSGNMNNIGASNRGGFQGNQMGGMQAGFGGQGQMGGFNAGAMGGFQNNFGNRGGMMGGMRGGPAATGRGGRGGFGGGAMPNMMGGMNMPNMGNMGNMGGMGNMGMMGGQFGGPMGMNGMAGFGAQGHFNPAFFQNNQQMGTGNDWNPHGAKRPRPE